MWILMILGRDALDAAKYRDFADSTVRRYNEGNCHSREGVLKVLSCRESDVSLGSRLRGDDSLWIVLLVRRLVSDVVL